MQIIETNLPTNGSFKRRNSTVRLFCTTQRQPRERGGGQPLAPRARVDRHRLSFLHPQGRQGLQRPPGMGGRRARAGAQQPRNRAFAARAAT